MVFEFDSVRDYISVSAYARFFFIVVALDVRFSGRAFLNQRFDGPFSSAFLIRAYVFGIGKSFGRLQFRYRNVRTEQVKPVRCLLCCPARTSFWISCSAASEAEHWSSG